MSTTGFLLGITEDDKERARQDKLSSQVKGSVLLSELESVPAAGSEYDTMQIEMFRDTSARLKLPKVVTDTLDMTKGLDIRINRVGDIIVLLPVENDGHMVMARKNTAQVFSARLASKFRDKGITLPVQYTVSADEAIKPDKNSTVTVAGWVCRKRV